MTKQQWDETATADLKIELSDETWEALLKEALALREEANSNGFEQVAAHRDGSFATPARFHSVQGGTVFRRLHRSIEFLEAVRRAVGMPRLIPVRCGYNYYGPGDYLGLHRDSVKATVTLNFAVTPNLDGLHWAPELRLASNDKLAATVAEDGIFPAKVGTSISMPHRTIVAFDGYNVPHWRKPFESDLGLLANCCYFDL
ncbi:MAG TPA: hypothetical protein VFX70_04440 [Mycobacteriales bacterium]|nr:hypothetical protein [Mycobacteriales bacterium]